ncbi:MAG: holo-[acyl-carrier-protein] synthase [Anaerolineales bacterium]|nr:MAG: holo-[acyl-carrier-protein] synthase [Anaerolineales bacterium]
MIRTGVDLIEVERIDRAILRHGDRFFQRFFTLGEIVDASGQTPALAARFSAKEAVAKALGTGIGEVGWKDIEITKGSKREPILTLHGQAKALADRLGLDQWTVSLSHTHEHAIAIAVAIRTRPEEPVDGIE